MQFIKHFSGLDAMVEQEDEDFRLRLGLEDSRSERKEEEPSIPPNNNPTLPSPTAPPKHATEITKNSTRMMN